MMWNAAWELSMVIMSTFRLSSNQAKSHLIKENSLMNATRLQKFQ